MENRPHPHPRSKRPYVVAMLLGTALSAFGSSQALRAETPEATLQAIADMGRYCTACWRNARLPADAWSDCTQEVFRRLLERVPADSWDHVLDGDGPEHREFVRAIDTVKKRTQRARKWANALDGVADGRVAQQETLRSEREMIRQAAEELLSPRQQRILQMSFEGWSMCRTPRIRGARWC